MEEEGCWKETQIPSRKGICTFTVDSARCYKHLRCWGEFAFISSLEVLPPRAAPLPSGHAEGTSHQGKEQGPVGGEERRGEEKRRRGGRSRARGRLVFELQLVDGPTPSRPV